MNNQKLKCRIIMKTDIKGFSNRIGLLSDLELSTLLTEHKLFIKNKVEENNGIIIKGEGDAFWIVFDSATKAVQSAISIQNELREDGVGKKENALHSERKKKCAAGAKMFYLYFQIFLLDKFYEAAKIPIS